MKKEEWEQEIIAACKEAGTYRDYFDSAIKALAEILETRDQVRKNYEDSGAMPVVQHTNKGGATNIVKNPILVVFDDLSNTALTYWRELGLTPKGLKAIDEGAMKRTKQGNTLTETLRNLGI